MSNRYYLFMTTLFAIVSVVIYFFHKPLAGVEFWPLEICALLVYALSLVSFLLVKAQVKKSPMAFVRGVTGASLLKMMVCASAMLVYMLLNKDTMQRAIIFAFFFIYAIFTALETALLSRMARKSN